MWDVEGTDEFAAWFGTLTEDQQEALDDRVNLLAERGPDLGRPTVDRVPGSRHHQMKELRASRDGALRVLFMFPSTAGDPALDGDKSGQWEAWYRWAIPAADDLYDEYLDELRVEGLI